MTLYIAVAVGIISKMLTFIEISWNLNNITVNYPKSYQKNIFHDLLSKHKIHYFSQCIDSYFYFNRYLN